ncbi:MAG TPA: hypothetical protein VK922_05555 [Gemmatimonadaceae bacterium]|nr:hypothetical protein [Gemmatimonadaceae bacterium]
MKTVRNGRHGGTEVRADGDTVRAARCVGSRAAWSALARHQAHEESRAAGARSHATKRTRNGALRLAAR